MVNNREYLFARALANRPLVVFADEPTANLDTKNRASIMELINNLHKEYNTTFVIVTHDVTFRENADRVIEMKDGQIISDSKNKSKI